MKKLLPLLLLLAAALPVSAKIVTRPIAYEHAGTKLEGYLAYDDALTSKGKRAGVLIVHEWWGLNDYVRGRAEQLAKLGYVALALDMYGAGINTMDPKRAGELAGQFYGKALMAERAAAGLEQLLKTGLVDEGRVAAIGYCFGGSTVQALAFSGASLAGIVSFHGGLIPVPLDAAGKTKAKILICHGAIDPFVKEKEIEAFMKSMNDGKFDFQFISYAGAVHAFTNPKADQVAAAVGLKGIGYNAAADHRSWEHMRVFFAEVLEHKTP